MEDNGVIGHINMESVPIGVLTKGRHTYSQEAMKDILHIFEERKAEANANFGLLGIPAFEECVCIEKVAFCVTRLWIEDNMLQGEADILDTPMGRLLLDVQSKLPHTVFYFGCTGDSTGTSVNEVTNITNIHFYVA